MARWTTLFALVAAAAPAGAEETRRPFSISATVTDSCVVSSGSSVTAQCTRGTSWSRTTSSLPLTRNVGPAPLVERGRTYLTVSY